MIYVITGSQTTRGRPPPLVGASIVLAGLWVMFAAALINTLVF